MKPPADTDITGLILAGGEGRRMGGVDKGLQPCHGQPLVARVLARLAPQVGTTAISANRSLDAYAALGQPVWTDLPEAAGCGPLSGLLSGLTHAHTPWLLSVPCDVPGLPLDLGAQLAAAMAREQADIAIACTLEDGELRRHPVFCLLNTEAPAGLRASLAQYLACGERRLDRWTAQHRRALVVFDDARAFRNLNTLADLAAFETIS